MTESSVHYPDHVWQGVVAIEENVRLARDTYRMRFRAAGIACRIVPGQFIMVRLAGSSDPLLGRPLAVYDTVGGSEGDSDGLDIVYLAVGKMTRLLATCPVGERIEVWGPLGNGFPLLPTEHLVMVAGGIGQTPFLSLAAEYLNVRRYGSPPRTAPPAGAVTLCYGARSEEYLAGIEDFRRLGVTVHVSTDDGSAGHRGLVTDLLPEVIARSALSCRIVCCGPEPMMAATARIADRLGVPCQVSLETPMACGIGICFSCAAKVRDAEGGWDYRRTCVEGPVFDAQRIAFD